MVIVGLSVVVTVIVLQYHHHDPDGGKMPKWVRPFPAPHPPQRVRAPPQRGRQADGSSLNVPTASIP